MFGSFGFPMNALRNLLPGLTNTYDFGSNAKTWNKAFINFWGGSNGGLGLKLAYVGNPAFNAGAGSDTGINSNADSQANGVFHLAMCSCQNAAGNATSADFFMLRVGSSGNNGTATTISHDPGGSALAAYTWAFAAGTIFVIPPGVVNTFVTILRITDR